MSEWSLPQELDQPLPRQVKTNPAFKRISIFMAAIFLGSIIVIVGVFGYSSHKIAFLRDHGILIEGIILNKRVEVRDSRGMPHTVRYIHYRFTPDAHAPSTYYEGTRDVSESEYESAQIGQSVPIVYNPMAPTDSQLNYNNSIRKYNPYSGMLSVAKTQGEILVGYIFIMIWFLRIYFKEKKLLMWGSITSAEIVSKVEVPSRNIAQIKYRFLDSSGKMVEAECIARPKRTAPKSGHFQTATVPMLDNPTVLYDPQDSSVNKLYPLYAVVCCAPV